MRRNFTTYPLVTRRADRLRDISGDYETTQRRITTCLSVAQRCAAITRRIWLLHDSQGCIATIFQYITTSCDYYATCRRASRRLSVRRLAAWRLCDISADYATYPRVTRKCRGTSRRIRRCRSPRHWRRTVSVSITTDIRRSYPGRRTSRRRNGHHDTERGRGSISRRESYLPLHLHAIHSRCTAFDPAEQPGDLSTLARNYGTLLWLRLSGEIFMGGRRPAGAAS